MCLLKGNAGLVSKLFNSSLKLGWKLCAHLISLSDWSVLPLKHCLARVLYFLSHPPTLPPSHHPTSHLTPHPGFFPLYSTAELTYLGDLWLQANPWDLFLEGHVLLFLPSHLHFIKEMLCFYASINFCILNFKKDTNS